MVALRELADGVAALHDDRLVDGFGPGVGGRSRIALGLAVLLGQSGAPATRRPGATALNGEYPAGNRDLLGFLGLVGFAGVGLAAETRPGARGELQPTVVAVAGVDLPVATALADGNLVPHCGLGRFGRHAAGKSDAQYQGRAGDHPERAFRD